MKTLLLSTVLLASALRADVQVFANELPRPPLGTAADTGVVQVLVLSDETKIAIVTITYETASGFIATTTISVTIGAMAFVEIGEGARFISASAQGN